MKNQHVTYDSIAVGDKIPPFETFETQETIDNTRMPEITARPPRPNIHTDPEFAKKGLFAGTVNGGVITMAYVTTMLERWFPAASFYDGGRLEFKAIQPFRPGDNGGVHRYRDRQAAGRRQEPYRLRNQGHKPARTNNGIRHGHFVRVSSRGRPCLR